MTSTGNWLQSADSIRCPLMMFPNWKSGEFVPHKSPRIVSALLISSERIPRLAKIGRRRVCDNNCALPQLLKIILKNVYHQIPWLCIISFECSIFIYNSLLFTRKLLQSKRYWLKLRIHWSNVNAGDWNLDRKFKKCINKVQNKKVFKANFLKRTKSKIALQASFALNRYFNECKLFCLRQLYAIRIIAGIRPIVGFCLWRTIQYNFTWWIAGLHQVRTICGAIPIC